MKSGRVEEWKGGRGEEWKSGRVEEWKGGRVEEVKSGRVEEWILNVLGGYEKKSAFLRKKHQRCERYIERANDNRPSTSGAKGI